MCSKENINKELWHHGPSISHKFKEVLDLLEEDDQLRLVSGSKIESCMPGAVVYAEGDVPKSLLFLNTGKVKICKKGIAGKEQIIRLIKAGWFFGYRALLAEDNYYQATAEVFEEAEIISIAKGTINNLLERNHHLSAFFVRILASDLAKSNEHTLTLTQKHLRGRLANALLILEETYGLERDSKMLLARMSRGDLANLANMNIANTSRVLKEFAQEGLLCFYQRNIVILDKKALLQISETG